jgi:NTE family protein
MGGIGTFGRYLASLRGLAADAFQVSRPGAQSGPRLALALQGGGAHGAFTWGVLDALLERGVTIDAVSGASAGAFNAIFLAHGWLEDGPAGAREALATLWRRIGAKGAFSPLQPSLMDQLTGGWNMDRNAKLLGFDLFTRILSPYQFNPLDMNPLRDLLVEHIDFDRLRRSRRIRLFLAATDVESGHLKLFTNKEITAEAVLASATLPWLHHAVEVGGRHYWDGGFTANPPILPLLEVGNARDILLVRLDSGGLDNPPLTARAIHARLNQIMFTAPLNHDLDQFADLQRMARAGSLGGPLGRRLVETRLHAIEGGEDLQTFGQSSKMTAHRGFLRELHGLGRTRAEAWLDSKYRKMRSRPSPQPAGKSYVHQSK